MTTSILQLLGGLVLLLLGGRLLVSASVDTARRLHVSPLLIGLTLVAWGTSAPEFSLNVISALKGHGDLAVGNVVGANICNMSLVLGLCALMQPLLVNDRIVRVEVWVNAGVLVIFAGAGLAGFLGRLDGAIMLAIFAVYSVTTIIAAKRESSQGRAGAAMAGIRSSMAGDGSALMEGADADTPDNQGDAYEKPPLGWLAIVFFFIGGLALLTAGGSIASDGATDIALGLGVPVAVVGVTIVSIGTTLPELATSVIATRRGSADLAVGNVIGSCLFNCGAVFGVAGLIGTPPVDGALALPLIYMGILAIVLIPISRTRGRTISRVEGGGLLASYVVFLAISAVMVASR